MPFRTATTADFEVLASTWLADLWAEPFLRVLCSEALEERLRLHLYNAVASFLQDPEVTTIVEHDDDGVVQGFAVCDASESYTRVHIAYFWVRSGHDGTALAKMVQLDRPIEDVVLYQLFAPRLMQGAKYDFLALLERCFCSVLTEFAKSERPRVLQALADDDIEQKIAGRCVSTDVDNDDTEQCVAMPRNEAP